MSIRNNRIVFGLVIMLLVVVPLTWVFNDGADAKATASNRACVTEPGAPCTQQLITDAKANIASGYIKTPDLVGPSHLYSDPPGARTAWINLIQAKAGISQADAAGMYTNNFGKADCLPIMDWVIAAKHVDPTPRFCTSYHQKLNNSDTCGPNGANCTLNITNRQIVNGGKLFFCGGGAIIGYIAAPETLGSTAAIGFASAGCFFNALASWD